MLEIEYGAIPTIYNHVQYRSRLEARFAAFLDLQGHIFDYEPFDLQRYIPDFIVELPEGPVLFECKPSVVPAEFRGPCRRITRSGWQGPAIVVGSRLTMTDDEYLDLTMYGSTHAELGRWSRVGKGRWPKAWGEYPFRDVQSTWAQSGNTVMWKGPSGTS